LDHGQKVLDGSGPSLQVLMINAKNALKTLGILFDDTEKRTRTPKVVANV
jgi:hypothetical protein